jgi:hypothetical protein
MFPCMAPLGVNPHVCSSRSCDVERVAAPTDEQYRTAAKNSSDAVPNRSGRTRSSVQRRNATQLVLGFCTRRSSSAVGAAGPAAQEVGGAVPRLPREQRTSNCRSNVLNAQTTARRALKMLPPNERGAPGPAAQPRRLVPCGPDFWSSPL